MNDDNLALTDRSRVTSDKWRIRPNNYVILAHILRNDSNIHLPSVKNTGWHGSTVREYERMNGVTIERTTKNVLFYLKKKFIRMVTTSEEIDKVDKEVKDFLIDATQKFQERYPTIVLDLMNAKFIRKEIEVKDKNLKLPKNLLMQDTIMKKVYKKDDSFEMKTLRSPELLKQYVKNRAIENWSPELAKQMTFIVEQQDKFAKNLETHLEVLKNLNTAILSLKRESFFSKIKRLFK